MSPGIGMIAVIIWVGLVFAASSYNFNLATFRLTSRTKYHGALFKLKYLRSELFGGITV